MATTYVVLQETDCSDYDTPVYVVIGEVEATNAMQARVRASVRLPETDVDKGVTLIAVPARNWRTGRGTLKAETHRRIRSA